MSKSKWMATLWVACIAVLATGCSSSSISRPVKETVTINISAKGATIYPDGIEMPKEEPEPVAEVTPALEPEISEALADAFVVFGDMIHMGKSHENELLPKGLVPKQVSLKFSEVCALPNGIAVPRKSFKSVYPIEKEFILSTDENGKVAKEFTDLKPNEAELCMYELIAYASPDEKGRPDKRFRAGRDTKENELGGKLKVFQSFLKEYMDKAKAKLQTQPQQQ